MMGLVERRLICDAMADRYYPRAARREHRLRRVIEEHLPPGGRFLDAGSGPYIGMARHFVDRARLSVGMDLVQFHGRMLATGAHAVRGDLCTPPFLNEVFDVVSLRSVAEHLADPVAAFRALGRLVKPGGWLVVLAPSRWYFAALVGRWVPEGVARRTLEFVFGSTVHDNFPVYYRVNTPRSVGRVARSAGLELVQAVACPHPPGYVKFSPMLFRLCVAYDRMIGVFPPARILQASFLYIIRKP